MRNVSSKQAAINRSYKILKDCYLEAHPGCEFWLDCDTGEVVKPESGNSIMCNRRFRTTVHHKMGRGIHTLEVEYFMSACQPHHDWAEHNKKKARNLGYILYR